MGMHNHKKEKLSVKCHVITVSDTRTEETDKSGNLMVSLLKQDGHQVVERSIIPDESKKIEQLVQLACHHSSIDVILINGGTGIAKRDVTIETVQPMFEKEIQGFGEIFRMISYKEDIGSAAILSRATAGIYQSTAIFCTPGSRGAVRLAMEKLILPELSHVVSELNK